MSPLFTQRPAWGLLACVVVLAALVRFAGLGECPAGLFRDEAEKGYSGWSLAATGAVLEMDARHPPRLHRWPWMINVLGTRTSAIYQYASIPFMRLGGLTPATTRMASALAGTLAVLVLGTWAMRLWGGAAGAWVAVWLALCPWHLVFSRWALQGIFVPLFVCLTLWGLLGLERGRRWGCPLAGAALGWLFYSYSGAQPFVLAWGACLLFLFARRAPWRSWEPWVGLALFLLPVLPTVAVRLSPEGSERLGRLALWTQPGLGPLEIAVQFLRNYASHLNPVYLFWSGDVLPRHCIPGQGQLLVCDALLVPAGMVWMWRRSRLWFWILISILACGPLPAAITAQGNPHALRSIGGLVAWVVFGGLGAVAAAGWLLARLSVARAGMDVTAQARRARLWVGLLLAALLGLAGNSTLRYFRLYVSDPLVAVAFEQGHRAAWETIARQRRDGQRIFINGQIPYAPYFQLFFMKLPPAQVTFSSLEAQGGVYYDPATPPQALRAQMRPGDWLLEVLSPAQAPGPGGAPLVTPSQAARLGEAWIQARQLQ